MTQDFARKKPTPTKKTNRKPRSNTRRKPAANHKAPIWAWTVMGLLAISLVALVAYIAQNPKSVNTVTTTPEPAPPVTQAPQPRFDFYEILKQQEIEVPDRSGEIIAKTPDDIAYYLQAGSFRSAADADRLRAQLLLLNLEASVETASSGGQNWHRVVVGPFDTRSQVAKARSILAANEMSPLLLKRQSN